MSRQLLVLAALAALAAGAAPLRGQNRTLPGGDLPHEPHDVLMALALSDLTFGTVLPGIPASVGVFQSDRAALFELRGGKDLPVRVEMILPTALLGSGGALLSISFGATDAFADFSRGKPPRGVSFDPHAPLIGMLGPNGRLYVRLGGTITPGRPQTRGPYSASIFLTVYDIST